MRPQRRTADGGAPAQFGEVKQSIESTKTRERRLGEVARTIGSSVEHSRRQRCDETRLPPRRRSCPFSATAAARLGLRSVAKLGLGSSVRPWLLFKRLPSVHYKPSARSPGRIAQTESGFLTAGGRGRG